MLVWGGHSCPPPLTLPARRQPRDRRPAHSNIAPFATLAWGRGYCLPTPSRSSRRGGQGAESAIRIREVEEHRGRNTNGRARLQPCRKSQLNSGLQPLRDQGGWERRSCGADTLVRRL